MIKINFSYLFFFTALFANSSHPLYCTQDNITKIDNALDVYYKTFGIDTYFNDNNTGKLAAYCEENGFENDDIEPEFSGDAKDCMLLDLDEDFPLRSGYGNDEEDKKEAIFNILKNCYRYGSYLNKPKNTDSKDNELSKEEPNKDVSPPLHVVKSNHTQALPAEQESGKLSRTQSGRPAVKSLEDKLHLIISYYTRCHADNRFISVEIQLLIFNYAKGTLEDLECQEKLMNYCSDMFENVDYVTKLLKNGVDVNAKNIYKCGSPLIDAYNQGHKKIVNLLIQYKADPNLQNKWGYTVLHLACKKKDLEAVRELLNANNNINLDIGTELEGNTPLMIASMSGCGEIYNLLIKNGADVNLENKFRQTAEDLWDKFKIDQKEFPSGYSRAVLGPVFYIGQ